MKTFQKVQEALDRANRALDTITNPTLRKEIELAITDNFQLEIDKIDEQTSEEHHKNLLDRIEIFSSLTELFPPEIQELRQRTFGD